MRFVMLVIGEDVDEQLAPFGVEIEPHRVDVDDDVDLDDVDLGDEDPESIGRDERGRYYVTTFNSDARYDYYSDDGSHLSAQLPLRSPSAAPPAPRGLSRLWRSSAPTLPAPAPRESHRARVGEVDLDALATRTPTDAEARAVLPFWGYVHERRWVDRESDPDPAAFDRDALALLRSLPADTLLTLVPMHA